MTILFNELSFSKIAPDEKTASNWMTEFFDAINALSIRLHKKVFVAATSIFSDKLISNNYYFSQWLHTLGDKEKIRKIIAILTHLPLRTGPINYRCEGQNCIGLGAAHEEKELAISYPEADWNDYIQISSEQFNEAGGIEESNLTVRNIKSKANVFVHFPARVFEHHRQKHDNHRNNLDDGESTLLYDIPNKQEIVQNLLDTSFNDSEDNEVGSRRFNWDENRGKYVVFNWHTGLAYHGYHILNENDVPHTIKKKIEVFRAK